MAGILQAVIIDPMSLPITPLYQEGTPHHVTLSYGGDRASVSHLIGLPVTVGAIEHCHNEEIQAIRVVLPSWLHCQNPNPHITVSWVPGSAPVRSNAMLAGEHESEAVSYPVHCIIEWIEWGEQKPDRVCSHCKTKKLRADNKSGICAECQPKLQKNYRYR